MSTVVSANVNPNYPHPLVYANIGADVTYGMWWLDASALVESSYQNYPVYLTELDAYVHVDGSIATSGYDSGTYRADWSLIPTTILAGTVNVIRAYGTVHYWDTRGIPQSQTDYAEDKVTLRID